MSDSLITLAEPLPDSPSAPYLHLPTPDGGRRHLPNREELPHECGDNREILRGAHRDIAGRCRNQRHVAQEQERQESDRFAKVIVVASRQVVIRLSVLLQLGVFGFGLLKDRHVGVGVFPESEKVLVLGSRFRGVTLHRIRPRQPEMR